MLPSWQIKQPFGMLEPEKCRHILAEDCVDFPKNGIGLAAAKAFALLAHQKCATPGTRRNCLLLFQGMNSFLLFGQMFLGMTILKK